MTTGGVASDSERRDWPQLPDVLLDLIMRRFTKLKDVVSFQAACKPWRQAAAVLALENNQAPGKFRQTLPWLMRRCESKDCHRPSCHRFIDAAAAAAENSKIVVPRHVNVAGDDPSVPGRIRSTFGWLLRATKQHSLFLFNPLTGNHIPLPAEEARQLQGDRYFPVASMSVQTFAMSAEPTEEGCIVMICYDVTGCDRSCRHVLAICKTGDQQWRLVPLSTGDEKCALSGIMDMVFWRGKFHAVCKGGDILVCDLSAGVISWAFRPSHEGVPMFGEHQRRHQMNHTCHLLVSPEDELMMVIRRHNRRLYRPGLYKFKVYKIDVDGKRWDDVVSLGDYALFLDSHKGTYVSIKDHPECKRNCVYYQTGIFDLGTKKNDSFFDFIDDNHQRWPIGWILPSNY